MFRYETNLPSLISFGVPGYFGENCSYFYRHRTVYVGFFHYSLCYLSKNIYFYYEYTIFLHNSLIILFILLHKLLYRGEIGQLVQFVYSLCNKYFFEVHTIMFQLFTTALYLQSGLCCFGLGGEQFMFVADGFQGAKRFDERIQTFFSEGYSLIMPKK